MINLPVCFVEFTGGILVILFLEGGYHPKYKDESVEVGCRTPPEIRSKPAVISKEQNQLQKDLRFSQKRYKSSVDSEEVFMTITWLVPVMKLIIG